MTEVVPGHRLVDDGHARTSRILEPKVAPGQERRSEGLEVLWRNSVHRNPPAGLRVLAKTLDRGELAAGRARNGRHGSQGSGLHTGNRMDPIDQVLVLRRELISTVAAPRAIQGHQQHGTAIEAEISGAEARNLTDEEPGGRQQDQ